MKATDFASIALAAIAGLSGCITDDDEGATTRQGTAEKLFAISNDGDEVDLVLTTSSVYMQLSEQTLQEVSEEFARERAKEEDNRFAQGLKNFVLDGVEGFLDERIEYAIEDIDSISWEDGELVFDIEDEHWLSFDDIDVDRGDTVLSTFNERDALEFIARFEEVKNSL